MNKQLKFIEDKYGHNSWKDYPPSKQEVSEWLKEYTEDKLTPTTAEIEEYVSNKAKEYDTKTSLEDIYSGRVSFGGVFIMETIEDYLEQLKKLENDHKT